jgi:hypothetical protein
MKRLLICLSLLGILLIPSVFAQVTLESEMSDLVDITEDIKNLLSQNIRGLLTAGNTTTGEVRNAVNTSNTLLTETNSLLNEVRDIIEPFEGYLVGIRTYLRMIYEFITQERMGPDFQPEVRYYGFQNVVEQEKEQTDRIAKRLDNLVQYGQYTDEVDERKNYIKLAREAAISRENQFPQGYSATSAQSILGKDQYAEGEDDQKKAAIAFLQNAVGNVMVPVLRTDNPSADKATDYIAYQRTMAAIQSVAARNVVEAYTSRIPVEYVKGSENVPREVKSKLQLLKEMNTFYPADANYWSETGPGSLGLAQKALAFFDLFFAFNFSLNQFSEQLDKINLQLSLLITQNTLLSKLAYGDMVYSAARKETRPAYSS